ncbi:MAG: long-chain fatty acid--CoA ligase [Bacteroidetes bacterium]|nr:long-chain fatty acid--CoA ligase [Bacteroidota bacterium]
MNITRLFDILELYRNDFSWKTDAFARNENNEWIRYSSGDYVELSSLVSYGLMEMGVKKGDKIVTISQNRPEWNFLDMGMAQAGIVHVPVYPTLSASDQEYILRHSEARMLIVSDRQLLQKIKPQAEKIDNLEYIFTFSQVEGERQWLEILEKGKESAEKRKEELEKLKATIEENDLLTIIYTSGTTGNPKGVMLSHRNILSNAMTTASMLPLNSSHRALSFLPLCHVYERMMNYNFQINGVSLYYVENLGKIGDYIKEVKPHVFNTVPRLIEKVYDSIVAKGKDLKGIKKSIFFWSLKIAHDFELNNGKRWYYEKKRKLADRLVFSKWRKGLGGDIELMVSGGSSLQERLLRVFWAAGIPVYEGYGLTESSPVIAVNDPVSRKRVKFGTVGPVLAGVEVRIAEDGEILCKGPNVMMGYYKDDEQTREVIDQEGWLHTGDIGVMVDEIFVKITDRKKEMFKTSAGKYIAPQVIENILKESMLIEQAMVVGANEKFASALISPNFNYLHFFATKHKIHFQDNEDLIRQPQIIKKIQGEVNTANKRLGQTEQIKRFRLVCDEWSPQTGALSPTLKLKRKVIYEKYERILQEIYGHA